MLLLALLLFWTPPALTCRGTPEIDPLVYEVMYRWCFMHFGPECPLTLDGQQQPCRFCMTPTVQTAVSSVSLPDPGRDEVIAYNVDWIAAVDLAQNRSDETCQ